MTAPATPQASPESKRGARFWQWLWRGEELDRVRALLEKEGLRQERLKRARIAVEVADRAFDPVDPLAFASTLPLALTCYREAAYWALLAQDTSLDAPDLKAAFERSTPARVSFSAGGERGIANLERTFVGKSFVDLAAMGHQELVEAGRAAGTFVDALLALRTEAEQRLVQLRRQRWRRVTLAAVSLIASVVVAVVVHGRLTTGPDLALGKPWRASSKLAECQPQIERCAGARTQIFFSTIMEENPWFEVDLGRLYDVSVVDIDNRTDSNVDFARGLTIDLSTDARTWVTVARQPRSFTTWRARFPSRKARYVRLSVPGKTILHLERVAVRER